MAGGKDAARSKPIMRLLIVTHTFPPSVISNAKRPFYVAQHFLQEGWEVDVFTSRFGMRPGQAETVSHPRLRIIRPGDSMVALHSQALSNPLLRAAALGAAAVVWPDVFAFWARKARRFISRRLPCDRVIANVLPASVLLLGRRLGMVDRSWVFDYQESATPYQRLHPRRSPYQRWLQPRLERLERDALHQAGAVIFTADTNRQAYIEQGLVPSARAEHIPYFFDSAVFQNADPGSHAEPGFHIVYFGTFDWRGERSPETFLRGLAEFLKQAPAARPRTKFVFYGNWLPEHDNYIRELHLQDCVSINAPLPYERYLEQLKTSPILLLVVSSAHNLFMPSKIVDYFGAARPILGLVPRSSEMRTVLENAGMAQFTADERDVAGTADALSRLWALHKAGALACSPEKTRFWSSDYLLKRYLEVVATAPELRG